MWEKLKSFIADDGLYTAALLIVVAVASFGLGRQSVIVGKPLKIIENKDAVALNETSNLAPIPLPNSLLPKDQAETETETMAVEGVVVASKSGTKYHLPTCSGAKSIKPDNLVTFASIAEAEAAGYTPAANCPGLK